MKKTCLFESHEKLGGKMIEFAGYMLPVEYESLSKEHEAVRNSVGIFDVSHMGEIEVFGEDALEFLQYIVTNDIKTIKDKQALYTFMCNENGGVVDDLLVYMVNKNHFYLVINASNIEKDYKWIIKNSDNFDVKINNISDYISEIAIQGPNAQKVLQKLTDTNLNDIDFFHFKDDIIIDGTNCLVSRTGYTGEDGFEIYTKNENIVKIWDSLIEVGKEFNIKPAGLGCRDTLRFEVCLPLYGNELSDEITPVEAGFTYFVKMDKGNFIGKEALAKQIESGIKRKLVGFELLDKGIARHGYSVKKDDNVIGHVTTGYMSPTLNKSIGLALIDSRYSSIDGEIEICIRKKVVKAKIINRRFYSKKYNKAEKAKA